MASIELLRLRAFARGDPAPVKRSLIEMSAWIRAQTVETVRTCRLTVSESRVLLDRLKADRAKRARA